MIKYFYKTVIPVCVQVELEDEEEEEEETLKDDWISRYEKLGMHVIAKAEDLNREQRFVTDGLLKPQECTELLSLTKVASWEVIQ